MLNHDLETFIKAIKNDKRLLGIDLGNKTIGLALSDTQNIIASPLMTISRTKFTNDVNKIITIIEQYAIAGIVIGWPKEMSGKEGKRCQSTKQFVDNLHSIKCLSTIPVLFWDERLSTVSVERVLIDKMDLSRQKRKRLIDKNVATYILQSFLQHISCKLQDH